MHDASNVGKQLWKNRVDVNRGKKSAAAAKHSEGERDVAAEVGRDIFAAHGMTWPRIAPLGLRDAQSAIEVEQPPEGSDENGTVVPGRNWNGNRPDPRRGVYGL